MYQYNVYLSNPTITVVVELDTLEPTEFELHEAAIKVISDYSKLDTYSRVS